MGGFRSILQWLILFTLQILPGYCLLVNNLSNELTLVPGEIKLAKLTLINDRGCSENIDLKLVDYANNFKGQHFYEDPSTLPRSNASWIELSCEHLTLAPKEQVDIFYTVSVPLDSTLSGSYWSVLLIEPQSLAPATVSNDDKFQLNVKIRFAHHIVSTIGEPKGKLKILCKSLLSIEERTFFCIDVENIGNYFLRPKAVLKLYNEDGVLEATLTSSHERLYPNNSSRYLFDVDTLRQKKYKGFLLLDNGDKNLFGENFIVEIP